MRIQILSCAKESKSAQRMLKALEDAARLVGDQVYRSYQYQPDSGLLILFGVGHPLHDLARRKHIESGGRVLLLDLGYFGDRHDYVRFSIDRDHPQHLLDHSPDDASRWSAVGIPMREDSKQGGHIVLVGMGKKSREYLGLTGWEHEALMRIRRAHPKSRVIYRPKRYEDPRFVIPQDHRTPIASLLKGASLVVCRHSNVAVDAVIAGVPFEAEDGAAMWLSGRPFSRDNRREFLERLAWWQWRPSEAGAALKFVKGIL